MKGYKVVSDMVCNGYRMTKTISEVELENLKKSEVFKIISIEEVGEYKDPSVLLSRTFLKNY